MGDVTTFEPEGPRDVRAALQAELAQSGLSLTRAADQIGRHSSSISRWLNRNYTGNNDAVAADVERWLETRADAVKHSLEGAGLDRHAETHATRKITDALAYAHATGDIVAVVGVPGRGKTWAAQRYCAGKSGAYYLAVSSAVFTLPGLLSVVGEAIGVGRQHPSALDAESTIIARLHDRQALLVVDEAHHLRDKLLDELRIVRDRSGCGLALLADKSIGMGACPLSAGRRAHRAQDRPDDAGGGGRGGHRGRRARAQAEQGGAPDPERRRTRSRRPSRAAPPAGPCLDGGAIGRAR